MHAYTLYGKRCAKIWPRWGWLVWCCNWPRNSRSAAKIWLVRRFLIKIVPDIVPLVIYAVGYFLLVGGIGPPIGCKQLRWCNVAEVMGSAGLKLDVLTFVLFQAIGETNYIQLEWFWGRKCWLYGWKCLKKWGDVRWVLTEQNGWWNDLLYALCV